MPPNNFRDKQMTPAEHARNAAVSLEAKKDRLVQLQSNDWKVTFTVQNIDMDARFTSAPMGTRYAMVLVEIGDDELPVQKEASAKPRQIAPKPDGAKRDWRDMPPSQQAGIRINDPIFAAYLKENHAKEWHETGDADACLKTVLRIESKTELKTDPRRMMLWHQLDEAFQAWKIMEHA